MPKKKEDAASGKGAKKAAKTPGKASEKKTKKPTKKKTEEIKLVEAEIVEMPKKGRYGGNGNLISIGDRAMEVQREIQSKGGKARAAKIRKQKELREFTKDFLFQRAALPDLRENMTAMGIEGDDMNNMSAMVVRLYLKAAIDGDLNAARTIIEWAGLAPLQQERENEAIAKLSQAMELAAGEKKEAEESFVFYIPQNGRPVIMDEK